LCEEGTKGDLGQQRNVSMRSAGESRRETKEGARMGIGTRRRGGGNIIYYGLARIPEEAKERAGKSQGGVYYQKGTRMPNELGGRFGCGTQAENLKDVAPARGVWYLNKVRFR